MAGNGFQSQWPEVKTSLNSPSQKFYRKVDPNYNSMPCIVYRLKIKLAFNEFCCKWFISKISITIFFSAIKKIYLKIELP